VIRRMLTNTVAYFVGGAEIVVHVPLMVVNLIDMLFLASEEDWEAVELASLIIPMKKEEDEQRDPVPPEDDRRGVGADDYERGDCTCS